MATLFMDIANGNDANDGTSFANRFKLFQTGATAARTAPGDVIRIMKSPDPTSMAQNATFTNGSVTVTLSSAVTANISLCEGAWTNAMGGNGATSTSTTRRQGSVSSSIAPAAGFTTGKMAYLDLGSNTDFSAYQQVSFWIRASVNTYVDSELTLRLCSDTTGDVTVDTFNIPAIPTANRWMEVTLDKGSALGSSIRSIALDTNADRGAVTILIDNILACKAPSADDSLTLRSLIGKNTTRDGWYPIQSINGTTVILDADTNVATSGARGYAGATATTTAYKREPIVLDKASQTIQESGTDGNKITYSGGWDTTAMTSQTGDTYITTRGTSRNFTQGQNYIKYERLHFVRLGNNNINGNGVEVERCSNIGGSNSVGSSGFQGLKLTEFTLSCNGNGTTAFDIFNANMRGLELKDCDFLSNMGDAITSGNTGSGGQHNATAVDEMRLNGCKILNNALVGLRAMTNALLLNCEFGSNGTASCTSYRGRISAFNTLFSDSTEFQTNASRTSGLYSSKHDQTANNHRIIFNHGTISSDDSVRHSSTGISWKLSPTSTDASVEAPLVLSVGKIACRANKQVTVKGWVRRSNTELLMNLVCRGGQIAGVDNDVTASISASADTWEQISISFTPTEVGVVEIECHAWGGTTRNGYIDDLTIYQG